MLGMVANHGVWKGVRLLSNESAAFIRERADVQGRRDQGRAFFHYFGDLLGHEGGELGVATTAQFDPSTGVGAVVLTNGDWCQGRAFEDALLGVQAHLLDLFGAKAIPNTTQGASRDSARRKAQCRGRRQHHPHNNHGHW